MVDLVNPAATAFQSGLLLIIPCLLGGFGLDVRPMASHLPCLAAGAVISALQGGGQALFALVDPVLCTFVGAAAALVALYPLSRWRRYAEPPQGITERPAMREERPDDASDRLAPMGLAMSFFPYVVLSVAALGVLAIEPVNRALRAFSIGMPFPAVTTGFGVANPVEEP